MSDKKPDVNLSLPSDDVIKKSVEKRKLLDASGQIVLALCVLLLVLGIAMSVFMLWTPRGLS